MAARKTSFYYSFLVLPADQRRAIIAVWDFCRAVDDAVDEADEAGAMPPREAVQYWRAELARCFSGETAAARRRAGACSRSWRSSVFRGRRSTTSLTASRWISITPGTRRSTI